MDNLQSVTYQTFEQDPVKYHNYEEVRLKYTSHNNANSCVRCLGDISGTLGVASFRQNVRGSSSL